MATVLKLGFSAMWRVILRCPGIKKTCNPQTLPFSIGVDLRLAILSALRLEQDQHDLVLTEIKSLLELFIAANVHGTNSYRLTAVFGLDLSDLRLRELRG